MIIDLHIHSTVSDGTDKPEEILKKVKEAGISLFSLTDHDAVKGSSALAGAMSQEDPRMISGAEFSCQDEKGKYHILGYRFDPDAESIQQLIRTGHQYRMEKMTARLEHLENEFGFSFPEEEKKNLLSMDNPGKPHLGNLMVRYGYAGTKDQAITEYINHLHVRSRYIRPEEAVRGILEGGGIPVLAHPPFGRGDQLITGSDLEERIRRLMDYGLQGLEGFYSGYTPQLRESILIFARQYGLYITAGSDYHGTNKPVCLGQTGLDRREESWPDGLIRFLGVCGFTTR